MYSTSGRKGNNAAVRLHTSCHHRAQELCLSKQADFVMFGAPCKDCPNLSTS